MCLSVHVNVWKNLCDYRCACVYNRWVKVNIQSRLLLGNVHRYNILCFLVHSLLAVLFLTVFLTYNICVWAWEYIGANMCMRVCALGFCTRLILYILQLISFSLKQYCHLSPLYPHLVSNLNNLNQCSPPHVVTSLCAQLCFHDPVWSYFSGMPHRPSFILILLHSVNKLLVSLF